MVYTRTENLYKVAVMFGKVIVGYRIYQTGGLFNTLVFKGYEWI